MTDSIIELAERLQKANWAYRNTDTLLMSDDEYDRLMDLLREKAPSHPFLKCIGGDPDTQTTLLPVPLASLDKVRMGESGLQRWQKRRDIMGITSCIVTEKLDGISCLLVCNKGTMHMYLRGNGIRGVDISRIAPFLGLPKLSSSCMIRGELVLAKDDTPPGSIGRSLVNGWVHRSLSGTSVPREVSKIHFVAYQVISPATMTRSQQLMWLSSSSFRIPIWQKLALKPLSENALFEILVQTKADSKYPIDGLVIGTDTIPVSLGGGEAKNPPDSIAFKASLEEQKKETNVVFVEWNVSRLNIWIPRIQIEPVVIGGATIEWLSGHSAKLISEGGIGKGSRIIIRRSGDVIPTLDTVITKCPAGPCLPPAGSWTWDANHVHAVRVEGAEGGEAFSEKALLHALQTLGVEGIGPGLVANLIERNINTLPSLLTASPLILKDALGPTRYTRILEQVKGAIQNASVCSLCIASNLLPRGVGERKLRVLFSKESSPRRWTQRGFIDVDGWSQDSLLNLLTVLPKVIAWCEMVKPGCMDVTLAGGGAGGEGAVGEAEEKQMKSVVFTGTRPDASLATAMSCSGWKMVDSLTKSVNLVVHADAAADSVKIRTAKKYGIEVCSLTQFRSRC